MARRPSEGTCGGSHDRNCFGDHWLIRIALLPAALTLAAIGITEVIAWHRHLVDFAGSRGHEAGPWRRRLCRGARPAWDCQVAGL